MSFLINVISESSTKQKITYSLALGGALYLIKSFYEKLGNFFKERNENKEIIQLIEREKEKFKINNLNLNDPKTKNEVAYFLYYKVLYNVYKNEFAKYSKKRMQIFLTDDLDKYNLYVQDFLKNLKFIEQNILQIIYLELNIDENEIQSEKDNINLK